MGTNGFKCSPKVKTVFTAKARGDSPEEEVGSPFKDELMEMCREKREQGMDTTQIERFIEEGLLASSKGQTLYSQVMLQIACDSLQ
jgi:hypothetical protein